MGYLYNRVVFKLKKKEILACYIMDEPLLNELSQSQKDKYSMTPLCEVFIAVKILGTESTMDVFRGRKEQE